MTDPGAAIRSRAPLPWVLWKSARPAQLLLILVVYALGAKAGDALAGASAETGSGALALDATVPAPAALATGALLLLPAAASVHYANEYADYETDARTERTPFSGGSGALQATGLPRTVALWAAAGSGAVAVTAAGLALATGRSPTAAAGLLAGILLFGWQYSVGPLRLAWRGLGEVDNAALGGLVLPAYGAAAVGGPPGAVALACLPFALVVFCNLLATQWPDREADAAVGKRTLVTRLRPRTLRRLYVASALAAGAALLALWTGTGLPDLVPTPVAGASLVAVPLLAWGTAGYTRRRVPLPTVAAMVVLAVAQLGAWCWLALGGP